MIRIERIVELAGLAGLALAIGVSFGCEWGPKARQRFKDSQEELCKTIESASKEKSNCLKVFPNNKTRREDCVKAWDDLGRELHKIKAQAAAAYQRCDEGLLDDLKKAAGKAIGAAAEAAGKKVGGLVVTTFCSTNFTDPFDHSPMTVSLTGTRIAHSGTIHTYTLGPASSWSVSYDDGLTFENYPASGTLTFDVQTGMDSQASLVDMDLSLDLTAAETLGYLKVRDDAANPIGFLLLKQAGTMNFQGVLCGWLGYARDYWSPSDASSYVTSLPVTFSPTLSTVTLASAVNTDSGNVFPSDPPPTSEFILYANFNSDVIIGQSATLEVDGLEPFAPITIYASNHLVAPNETFAGVTWVLDQPAQSVLVSGSADANGYVQFTLPVPNDPALVGLDFYFQGLALLSTGFKSTVPFSVTIEAL